MNPLAIIRGHSHLLQRRLQRPDALNEQTLPSVLAQLVAIDAAVSRIVLAMDTFEQTTERPQEEPDSGCVLVQILQGNQVVRR